MLTDAGAVRASAGSGEASSIKYAVETLPEFEFSYFSVCVFVLGCVFQTISWQWECAVHQICGDITEYWYLCLTLQIFRICICICTCICIFIGFCVRMCISKKQIER